MDRDKKPLTEQEKIEMDLMAEAELAKLLRQYRIMESDRKAFAEETSLKLAKQKSVISALQKEKHNLLTDLRVTMSNSNKRKDAEMATAIDHLLDEHDSCGAIIQKQKAHLNEVNKQIAKLEKHVGELRSKETTDAQFQEKIRSGHNHVQALKNQLDTEIKRFCTTLSKNRAQREEIDHLLKERAQFNTTWEKLLGNLDQGKKLMLDLIEQATVAYDQREEWGSKLRALRVRNQNDLMLHAQEMRELQRQLDHDHLLYEFHGVKGQKRILRDLEEKEFRKKETQRENKEKMLQHHHDMLREVQELAGEEDTARLSSQYVKQEEENFALFNYVNELHHEIEVIQESIDQLKTEIAQQKELNEIKAQQQKETIEILAQELEKATKESENAELRLNESTQEQEDLLQGIQALFDLVHCDSTPILQLLGDEATISNYNVMLYLGVLEKKIGEVTANLFLKDKTLLETKKKASEKSV